MIKKKLYFYENDGIGFDSLYILFVLFMLVFIKCSVHEEKEEVAFKENHYEFVNKKNVVSISNKSDQNIVFSYQLNSRFPISSGSIIQDIKNISKNSETSLHKAAWEYVVMNGFHSLPFTGEAWIHDPVLYFNSIGGGLCDDLSSTLVALWHKLGFEARLIVLEGHVVPEVKIEGNWEMYDPDFAIYYCDEKGKVLSVKDLENKPNIIAYPQQFCGFDQNPFWGIESLLTKHIAELYGSTENNTDETDWHLTYDVLDSLYELPSKSELFIISDSLNYKNGIVVVLSEASKGVLMVPLAPLYINGNMTIVYQKDTLVIDGEFTFSKESFSNKIILLDVEQYGEIHYKVNDKLSLFDTINNLFIQSSDYLFVQHTSSHPQIIEETNPELIYNLKMPFHFDYLKKQSQIEKNEDLFIYLLKEYSVFLKMDTTINSISQMKLRNEFIQYLLNLEDLQQTRALVTHLYPYFNFILFMGARYGQTEDIQDLLVRLKLEKLTEHLN